MDVSLFKIIQNSFTYFYLNKCKIEAQIMTNRRKALRAGIKVGCEKQVIIPPTLGHGAVGAGGPIPPDVPIQLKKRSILLAKVNR